MGVINLTPDSFSDGGRFLGVGSAISCAKEHLAEGADVLDLGAQSTRPGALMVGEKEELKRLIPALKAIRDRFPEALISVDTFLSKVAYKALEAGADWINDISGGRHDPDVLKVVSEFGCPYVITHSRGDSKSMNELNSYKSLVNDVFSELNTLTENAIQVGINPSKIIWDPGLGFAKDTNQNLTLLSNLERFTSGSYPILVGPSRKRFIGDILRKEDPLERVWGTAAVVCRCVQAKVSMVRVHDVGPMVQTKIMGNKLWVSRN